MALKIGDKVRFLNSTGGGIVRRFVSKDLVAVEEEDGFDTPVLIKECVVVEPITGAKNTNSASPSIRQNESSKTTSSPVKVVETKDGDLMNVALAFLPSDEKNLQHCDYETYLVNDSNYYIQFNYLSKVGRNWILRKTDTIEPNQQAFIEEFSKQQLNDLERICIQIIAHKKNKPFEFKSPVSVEIKIDTVKFYKLHSFQENDFFEDNALIFDVIKNDQAVHSLVVKPEEIKQAMQSKGDFQALTKLNTKQKSDTGILEIDLHIAELLDNTTGLSNADIIQIQLKKFNEVMGENLRNKGKKIVFIHGKGEGVLRKAVLDELRLKYKQCTYQDASFREYGFGATMVTIK